MDFLNTAFTFPTVIYSTLLLIVLLFWLISLAGFADPDMLDGDADIEAEGGADGGSLWQMGFGGVPLTVSISLIVALSWVVSYYAQKLFAYLLGDGVMFYLIGSAFMLGSLVVALPLAAALVRPLRGVFDSQQTSSKDALVGLECVIATGKVTTTFGQARVSHEGSEQLIEVRCDEENTFTQGDKALLIEHNATTHSYTIVTNPW
ncbi:OB-fold-containig protein [Pseudoalteromonas ardens]|uniref:Ubiquinone biosynthesis protein UbiH n=1 Tax=Pseudoalteromonas rubra TaxID=43658 RepID=A0A0L0EVX0_9GAMM|nr:OB-fold-containig protein [Pseudoalteromonas sp. R96]KNC68028.1 ubiquinone biosynthesis protein UbiH [Pseudoalteromonas rubra]MDK1310542.1 DUF1449 family protein [Pseudoalteromonas sp. R96]